MSNLKSFIVLYLVFNISWISPSTAQQVIADLAITNVTVIDGTGRRPIENATVLVKDGKIDCVGDCTVEANMEIIDGSEKYIIPGLIDTHVHYGTSGWFDGFPVATFPDVSDLYPYEEVLEDLKNNPQRFHKSYLCSGVTAVYDPGDYPWTFDVREKAENSTSSPHYYTTGPLLSFNEKILNHPAGDEFIFSISDESAMKKGMDLLVKNNADGVNIHNLHEAKNLQILEERLKYILPRALKSGMQPMVFTRGVPSAKVAMREGAKVLIYSIENEVVDDEFLEMAKENDIIYVPTLSVAHAIEYIKNGTFPENEIALQCIDDITREKIFKTKDVLRAPQKTEGESNITPKGDAFKVRLENLKKINEAGIRIAMGSSAGFPFLVHGPASHYEMINMVKAGLTPMEVLVASTQNGSAVIGRSDIGTIEEGKTADMVLLNESPLEDISHIKEINTVIFGGKVVRSSNK